MDKLAASASLKKQIVAICAIQARLKAGREGIERDIAKIREEDERRRIFQEAAVMAQLAAENLAPTRKAPGGINEF